MEPLFTNTYYYHSYDVSDRKKDLVKLQLGEYVSLAKVETVLSMSKLVDSVCVYASSEQMFVVCLIVLNRKHGAQLAETYVTQISQGFLCEFSHFDN